MKKSYLCMLKIKQDMSGENFDIFISYRRSDGEDIASKITETLKGKHYRCFLDYYSLKGGKFDEKIEIAIKDAPIFIAVMTPDYLVRPPEKKEEETQNHEKETEKEDWVYKEIECAIKNKKRIIPINYNNRINDFPTEVPANISEGLGAHTFAIVSSGQQYPRDMEALIKDWISETVPPPTQKTEGKANIEVYSDCDCNILKANEVIATVPKGGCSIIKLEKGEHRIICQSSEFSDIEQKVIKKVSEGLETSFIDIELANKVKQRQIAIAEKEKAEKVEAERKRKAEEARIASEKAEKDAIKRRQDEEKRRQEEEKRRQEEEKRRKEEEKRREEEKEKRKQKRKEWWGRNKRKLLITLAVIFGIAIIIGLNNSSLGETETLTETATEIPEKFVNEELFDEYVRKAEEFDIEYISNTDNKNLLDSVRYYYELALEIKDNKDIRERLKGL